jgi:hypothetical protein
MPRRGKKRAKRKDTNAESAKVADLQSPLQLLDLDTPGPTSSLTCTPSDLTPLLAASIIIADMDPLGMGSQSDMRSSEDPLADVHSKHQKPSPRYSRTTTINSFQNAFSSSKMLQQVLGLQPSEPYTRPSPMPHDLEQRFVAGLKEYGLNFKLTGESPLETLNRAATEQKKTSAGSDFGRKMLEAIREEHESPTTATHQEAGTGSRASAKLTINPPMWESGYEAVGSMDYTFTDHDQGCNTVDCQATNPFGARPITASSDTDFEGNEFAYHSYEDFGSTTTLADSVASRPSTSVAEPRMTWHNPDTTIQSAQIDSFAPVDYGSKYGASFMPPRRSSSLANLKQHLSYQAEGLLPKYYDDTHVQAYGVYDVPQRTGSAPVPLFPSPRVEQDRSWDFAQTNTGSGVPHGLVTGGFASNTATSEVSFLAQFHEQPQEASSVPKINVQAPSPTKRPNSKKRSATSQGAPPAKARATDSTTGLPVLAANQESLWKAAFPGNTHALLTLILPWSLSMQRLHNLIRTVHPFSINPAFPYPITPPIHQKLVSVAFYDTSVTPHKEIRFIGPSDVSEMSYNEVDTFAYPENTPFDAVQTEQDRKKNAMKRALGLHVSDTPDYKNMPMYQRAATGEGRWAYILLQGHRSPDPAVTPPHVIIAWHISTTTDTSDCLHTIYPDANMASRPTPMFAAKGPKRFSSLQNLAARFQDPLRLHQDLRAASSEGLSPVVEMKGALTLKRTVMKMEKAGRIPLIEGCMVDVRTWEGWMKAVGMGKGKVILWKERV